MSLTTLEWFLLILTILLLLSLIGLQIYWKFKKTTYTRERFAFFGITSIITVITAVLPTIFGSNLWLICLNFLTTKFFEYPIDVGTPDFSDRIVAILFVFLVGFLILRIFKNWNGDLSLRQFEQDKVKEKTTLIKETIAYLKDDPNLKIFNPVTDDKIEFNIQEASLESLPWHEQVADLLGLFSEQYKIDIKRDWYRKEKGFIAKYGQANIPIGIYCSINLPNEIKIQKFISFVEKQNSSKNLKFIVAVKNIDSAPYLKSIKDFDVEFISEESLLNNLVDFSSYFEFIREQFEEKPIIEGYNFNLKDVYTSPICKIKNRNTNEENSEETIIEEVEKYIIDWLNEPKIKKHLAILGEYGQGKSVLSQRIAYLVATNKVETPRIPIIIELRGRYPKQYQNILSLLSDWCSNFGINPKALLKLHFGGRLLIIFEGFDEMELVGDYEIRLDHFRRLWEFSTPNSKLIITGRPNFFLNDNELKTLLRTVDSYTNLPYCEELYIERFNLPQIKSALRNTDLEISADIISILENQNEGSSFSDLMSRPSSLFLTSIVWKERNLSQYKSNINSAIVIEEFLKHSYSRQASKGLKTPLSVYERAYFMQGIAIGVVLKNRYTNQVSQNDLKDIILKLYNNFPDVLTKEQVANSTYKKPLQKRFDKRYNTESVLLDIRSCGILVRDLSTFDSFKFAHKSFLELLVSDYLVFSILNKNIVIKNAINGTFDISSNSIRKSPDVSRFIAQLLAKKVDIPESLNPIEKVNFLFKELYPVKKLPMNWVVKMIPIFGKDIRIGLISSSIFLFISITGSVIFFNDQNRIIKEILELGDPFIFVIVTYLFFGLITHSRFSNVIQIQNQERKLLGISTSRYERIPFLSLITKIFKRDDLLSNDADNIILWFIVCKELSYEEELKKLLPNNLFKELEYNEVLLNQDKDKALILIDEYTKEREERDFIARFFKRFFKKNTD